MKDDSDFFTGQLLCQARLGWDLAAGSSAARAGPCVVWHGSAMGEAATALVKPHLSTQGGSCHLFRLSKTDKENVFAFLFQVKGDIE